MTNLAALLERVREAERADRELDALLACHFIFKDLRPARPDDFDGKYPITAGDMKCEHGFLMADRYTSSIDAALTLVERIQPCAVWSVKTDFGGYIGAHLALHTVGMERPLYISEQAATPALSLLAALLASLVEGE